MARSRRLVWVVSVVVAALVVVKCAVFPGRAFDAVLWNDKTQVESGVRQSMADRLVADAVLVGRTRAEVVAMLGEPEPPGQVLGWELVYSLGPTRALLGIDFEWLVARLGSDGRVAKALVVRD